MADPGAIVERALSALGRTRDLEGRRVLVTAGPTHEPVDAVRFLSNPSTGKMGFELACAARKQGADVTLVAGPVALENPAGVEVVRVNTALEMERAVSSAFPQSDIAVFAAAVSDYRPANPSARKLKKGADDEALSRIDLVRNPDILAGCGKAKRAGQVVVGFAAETDDLVENAQAKLASKNADFIVANDVSRGRVFGADENEVVFVSRAGEKRLPLESKRQVAEAILDEAKKFLK